MDKILILGGYARSGKTTLTDRLGSLDDIEVFSTSVLLHQFAKRTINNLCGTSWDVGTPLNKYAEYQLSIANADFSGDEDMYTLGPLLNGRELLIEFAESILVPTFGRQIFSSTVIRQAVQSSADYAIVESIGGEEYRLMQEELTRLGVRQDQITLVNLRRVEE